MATISSRNTLDLSVRIGPVTLMDGSVGGTLAGNIDVSFLCWSVVRSAEDPEPCRVARSPGRGREGNRCGAGHARYPDVTERRTLLLPAGPNKLG